mmetsp:Transcript_101869/g.288448  ORF Transcript_101869/g.288448 Transcript_101869/m.288448 type:complete len:417 (-) Transcript_101869:804-2054(-)
MHSCPALLPAHARDPAAHRRGQRPGHREGRLPVRPEGVSLAPATDVKVPVVVRLAPAPQGSDGAGAEGVGDDHLPPDGRIEQPRAALPDQRRGDRVGQGGPAVLRAHLELGGRGQLPGLKHVASKSNMRRCLLGEELRHACDFWCLLQQQVPQGPVLRGGEVLAALPGVLPPAPAVVVAEEGPVDEVAPVRIVALEAQLHDGLVPLHHLAHCLLGWPAEELAHLFLVRETEMLYLALVVRLDRQGQLAHGAGVEPVRLEVERPQHAVLRQRGRELKPLGFLNVRVRQRKHLNVCVCRHRQHELWSNSWLDFWGRHVHVVEVEVEEGWVIQPRTVDHPDHPVAVALRPRRLREQVLHVGDALQPRGKVLVDRQVRLLHLERELCRERGGDAVGRRVTRQLGSTVDDTRLPIDCETIR